MYRVFILKKTQADLDWFRKNDRQGYLKCFVLFREPMINPRQGTGKPERLKYFEKEVYSRRINHKDRLIYTVYEDIKEVDVSSCRGHYD